jgi:DNA-binding response OmpR family regulator
MTSVLMIDDDVEFCGALQEYLGSCKITVAPMHDASSGLAALQRSFYDLVLLDVMLPDADGLQLLDAIHRIADIPVLVLSAEGSDACRIQGLDLGADDFLPKPFNPRELVARIHAVLRRFEPRRQSGQSKSADETAGAGLSFDPSVKRAFFRGERLPLTGVEFDLLNLLAHSPGTILEREVLVTQVFQRPFNPLDRSLDMHISRLRRKLSSIRGFEDPIKTIRSSGYVFSPSAGKYAGTT